MPAPALPRLDPDQAIDISAGFADLMSRRRTIRDFSSEAVPMDVIRHAIRAAATAPSGANLQP